jgi:hypothetical protein
LTAIHPQAGTVNRMVLVLLETVRAGLMPLIQIVKAELMLVIAVNLGL